MKIILNNVARVQHAEVEIKGISVISGYNGTGKVRCVKLCMQQVRRLAD